MCTGVAGTGTDDVYLTLSTAQISDMYTLEGCFALSDKDGNLLFFSDGMTIWNKNKVPMTNGTGLTGNRSSEQSGIMLPRAS